MIQDTLDSRLTRAKQAERFLGDDLVKGLIIKQKDRLFTLWANSDPQERDKREHIYSEYRGLLRIVNEIRSYVTDGKIIEKRLEDDAE